MLTHLVIFKKLLCLATAFSNESTPIFLKNNGFDSQNEFNTKKLLFPFIGLLIYLPVVQAAITQDDTATTLPNTPVTIDVLANDTDNHPDVFFTDYSGKNQVCLGNGKDFYACTDMGHDVSSSTKVALGDMDKDGHLDAVIANYQAQNQLCFGDGRGHFQSCQNISVEAQNSNDVALGDINQDGWLDIVFANETANQICLAQGNGEFVCHAIGSDTTYTEGVALGDINGDRQFDVIFASSFSTNASTLHQFCLGEGTGQFTHCTSLETATESMDVILVDWQQTGKLAALLANTPGENQLCTSQAQLLDTCTPIENASAVSISRGIAAGDINEDGKLDIIVANIAPSQNQVCLNTGDDTFHCAAIDTTVSSLISSYEVVLTDVNHDHYIDAIFANQDGASQVCLGEGHGRFTCQAIEVQLAAGSGVATGLFGIAPHHVTLITPPLHGQATVNPKGHITYSPDQNFIGVDTFTYQAEDAIATVKVYIERPTRINVLSDPILNLTMSFIDNSQGEVHIEPSGRCYAKDKQCQYVYEAATWITLTAHPQTGSKFMGWGGGDHCQSDDNTLSLFMTKNYYCTAYFEPLPRTLTVTIQGQGHLQSQPQGIDCDQTTCSQTFKTGETVALTAHAKTGWQFSHWQGQCASTDSATQTLIMQTDKTCKAIFLPKTVLSIQFKGTGAGSVYIAPAGSTCTQTCQEIFAVDQPIILMAESAEGSRFTGWNEACHANPAADEIQFTLRTDTTCIAHFEVLPPPLEEDKSTESINGIMKRVLFVSLEGKGTVQSQPKGIVCKEATCHHEYETGSFVTLTPTAAKGFQFTGWTGPHCEGALNAIGDITLHLHSSRACIAHFEKIPTIEKSPAFTLPLTLAINGKGTIRDTSKAINCSGHCQYTFEQETSLILTAVPEAGWQFERWQGNCGTHTHPTLEITLTAALDCAAQFSFVGYRLAVDVIGPGDIESEPAGITCATDCVETYPQETTVLLTATPHSNAQFSHWTGDCQGDEAHSKITVERMVTCTAHFTAATCVANGIGMSAQGRLTDSQSCFNTEIRTPQGIQENHALLPYTEAKSVTLSATILVDTNHAGKAADVFIMRSYRTTTAQIDTMRVGKQWRPWSGDNDTLEPAKTYSQLPAQLNIPIYQGNLSDSPGEFSFFVIYRLQATPGLLYQSQEPLHFFVEDLLNCTFFAVHDQGVNDTQFFTLNPTTLETAPLGGLHKGYNIEALDIDRQGAIYAASSAGATVNQSYLYQIKGTRVLPVGEIGFAEVDSLAFDAQGILWGWARGQGLIQIDTTTGAGELIFSYAEQVEDISWSIDGRVIYAVGENALVAYDGLNPPEVICDLPKKTEGVEFVSDNLMLASVHGRKSISVMDINKACAVVATIPTPYNDIEGIARHPQTCSIPNAH
jgi:hypothetical protein